MKLPVLCAADGAAWEERLVTAFDREQHAVQIVRRCVDIVDVLAVAASGQGRAALLASGLRRLDADAVDRLRAAGVVPVGVVRRGDTTAEDQLRSVGVEHLVPEDADAAVVAAVLGEAVRAAAADASGSSSATRAQDRAYGDPSTSMAIPPGVARPVTVDQPSRRGSVVAIWGPTGAPGRTTVAVTLGDELARLGYASLLVDADVYGGTVAAVLGLLDESPGLAARVPSCVRATIARGGPRRAVLAAGPTAARAHRPATGVAVA